MNLPWAGESTLGSTNEMHRGRTERNKRKPWRDWRTQLAAVLNHHAQCRSVWNKTHKRVRETERGLRKNSPHLTSVGKTKIFLPTFC